MSIAIGDRCERVFHVSDETIEHFGAASEDRNPVHFDDEYAAGTLFKGRIAHGILTASFISAGDRRPSCRGLARSTSARRSSSAPRCGRATTSAWSCEVTDYDATRRGTVLDTRAYVGRDAGAGGRGARHRPGDVSQLVHDPALLDATDLVARPRPSRALGRRGAGRRARAGRPRSRGR